VIFETCPCCGKPKRPAWLDGLGTALKPAFEPVVWARKPLRGTVAANVCEHGTGAINVNGCRVDTSDNLNGGAYSDGKQEDGKWGTMHRRVPDRDYQQPAGRFPPNLVLTHAADCKRVGVREVKGHPAWNDNRGPSAFTGAETSPVCHGENGREPVPVYDCAPGCPVAELGRQSGESTTPASIPDPDFRAGRFLGGTGRDGNRRVLPNDTGTAARFFPQFEWGDADWFPFRYVAKASRAEREAGCEGLPAAGAREAVGRDPESAGVRSPRAGAGRGAGTMLYRCAKCGGGLGGSGGALRAPCPKGGEHDPKPDRLNAPVRNHHPTVKPIELMRWLCRLVTPPGGVVLDPFAGSGTTIAAAGLEGFRAIGIEREPDYAEIARARVKHLCGGDWKPAAQREAEPDREPPRQGELF
jgi:site-specific DNA-methyltransferase (adenine-specific)